MSVSVGNKPITTAAAAKKAVEQMPLNQYKINIDDLQNNQILIEGIDKKLSDYIEELKIKFNEYKRETDLILDNHYKALQLIIDKLGL